MFPPLCMAIRTTRVGQRTPLRFSYTLAYLGGQKGSHGCVSSREAHNEEISSFQLNRVTPFQAHSQTGNKESGSSILEHSIVELHQDHR